MNKWGDGSVCKSEAGDRYRQASEIDQRALDRQRAYERERSRVIVNVARAERLRARRAPYDPEAKRQRRYGMGTGAATVGAGWLGHKGYQEMRAANPNFKFALAKPKLGPTNLKGSGKLGGAAALLGGAGYLFHRGGSRQNQRWT